MFLSLQTLPVEIVFRILDCLTDKELLLSANNICQRWNTILSCYENGRVGIRFFYTRQLIKFKFSIFYRISNSSIFHRVKLEMKMFDI